MKVQIVTVELQNRHALQDHALGIKCSTFAPITDTWIVQVLIFVFVKSFKFTL